MTLALKTAVCFLRTFNPELLSFYPLSFCLDHQRQQSLLSNCQLIEPFSLDLEGATCFVDFGCCILSMVLIVSEFMYFKTLSIEEFLFEYQTFYVFGFIRDVFWKPNFYALSPVCNFFGEPKKTESLFAFQHHYSFN